MATERPHEEWRNDGPGTGTGTGTATKTGIGTETRTETGIGAETGTETGIRTETGSGTGTGAESRSGTESGTGVGAWTGCPTAQQVSACGIRSGSLPVWELDPRGVSGRGWALAGVPFES